MLVLFPHFIAMKGDSNSDLLGPSKTGTPRILNSLHQSKILKIGIISGLRPGRGPQGLPEQAEDGRGHAQGHRGDLPELIRSQRHPGQAAH